jgi:hypothetical protein
MRPVVATFTERTDASSIAERLQARFGLRAADVSVATAAAYREPYDGHALVVAWVPDELERAARGLVSAAGGDLRPQPWAARRGEESPPDAGV